MLGLPIKIERGYIGSATARWSTAAIFGGSDPIILTLDKVFIVVRPSYNDSRR